MSSKSTKPEQSIEENCGSQRIVENRVKWCTESGFKARQPRFSSSRVGHHRHECRRSVVGVRGPTSDPTRSRWNFVTGRVTGSFRVILQELLEIRDGHVGGHLADSERRPIATKLIGATPWRSLLRVRRFFRPRPFGKLSAYTRWARNVVRTKNETRRGEGGCGDKDVTFQRCAFRFRNCS